MSPADAVTRPQSSEPRHRSVAVFINNYQHGDTNGCTTGFSPQPSTEKNPFEHMMSCGHPGASSRLTWEYLRTDQTGDHYRFTQMSAEDDPKLEKVSKEVVFDGKELLIFEDDSQRVYLRLAMD